MSAKIALQLIPLAVKQVLRHRIRSLLTVLGIAAGMFLFTLVETLQRSVAEATSKRDGEQTLVVFRENRFCPTTSRLPEYYADEIRGVAGIREVIPVQIAVNNCGTSLDVVTFRGVPPQELSRFAPEIRLTAGTLADWEQTDDGALLGINLARRRGLSMGDTFEAAGVRVRVRGILRSPHSHDNNVAYVHLPFLQQASRQGLGVVTQFNVRVEPGADADEVARAIDSRFRGTEAPTRTRPENEFFAQVARDLVELARFTRWIGLGAILAVLGLVANAVLLVVRGRVRENAVLRTLGYSHGAIAWLVLLEGMVLGVAGGLTGAAASWLFLTHSRLHFGSEGQVMALLPRADLFAQGLLLALALGALASLAPAWTAVRRPIVESLRS